MKKEYVLTFSCPDQKGIQAKTSNFLFSNKAFLTDVQSYSDKETRSFFSRIVFSFDDLDVISSSFMNDFDVLAKKLSMIWSIDDLNKKVKTLIAVSKDGHCLNDLLYRTKFKDMPIEIVGVVSNHETFREIVEFNGYKFHYLPIQNQDKVSQEKEFNNIAIEANAELIVLARYMQILSGDFVSKWSNRCINIHHSFLPSFKGSKPYHQAYEKGVKIIGATAHYVTKDLDEGPIIEQSVERVNHRDTIEEIIRKGNTIESNVLSKAVRWHAEKKILLNTTKTIVFS